jgi:hypothetical protein
LLAFRRNRGVFGFLCLFFGVAWSAVKFHWSLPELQ